MKQSYILPQAHYAVSPNQPPRKSLPPMKGGDSWTENRRKLRKVRRAKQKRQKAYLATGAPSVAELLDEVTEKDGCRYMHGEPNEHGMEFCGKPRMGRSSYCEEHHNLCYRKPGEPWNPDEVQTIEDE